MTAIEQIIAIAEQLGWQVKTDTDKPNLVVFDFQQYTPHGQDFSFSVEMKGNDTDSLLQEVETYYEDFDPDYEAYLWIGTDGHGKNGAPYRIKDIVSDMEQAEAMIEKLNRHEAALLRKKRPIGTLRESDLQRIERTRNLLQHGSLNGIHYEKSKLQERFSELERHNGSKTALLQYSCRPF